MFTSTVKVYKWIERYEIILNHCIILQYSTRKIQHTSVAIVLNLRTNSSKLVKTLVKLQLQLSITKCERTENETNGAVAFIPSFADRYTRSISLENNNEWLNFAF